MSKGLKVVFADQSNVWNDVEGVERSLNSFNCYLCYSCRQGQSSSINCIRTVLLLCRRCWKKLKMVLHIFVYNFLHIQWIFNPKKVLESWDLALFNHTIKCYICQRMSKGSKVKITFGPFNIHNIWWYGCKGISLSFPKLFSDWKSIEY